MAPSSKSPGGNFAATPVPPKPSTNNGVITEHAAPAVNKKKAKRRAKEKARRDAAAQQRVTDEYASDELDDTDLAPPGGYPSTESEQQALQYDPRYPHTAEQYQDPNAAYAYAEEDGRYAYDPAYTTSNGIHGDMSQDMVQASAGRSKRKKARSSQYDPAYQEPPPPTSYYNAPPPRHRTTPTITEDALRTVEQKVNDDIWETSTREERDRIRQFWLKLPEDERRNLVRIEKDAVLRKMKEQQRHSCSCTVCGRKRTAIEEELEQLYDAYYTELEQFANGERRAPSPAAAYRNVQTTGALPRFAQPKIPSRGRIQELQDDEEEDDLDDLDGEYADDEDYIADDYTPEAYARQSRYMEDAYKARQDFFTFGRNLTVKGGILTVADDLLSNHGEKFIDMMDQLANARMKRENDAYAPYASQQHLHDPHPNHYPEEDEYDEEDDYDGEESLDEEFEEDDDDDEMDQLSNEQRMDEGRRMFQIFAARMFEQRVLGAYREDVSKKKAEQLIAEEEAEKHGDAAREAKKAREAEKKKQKKQAKKQEKADKDAKREAERVEVEERQKVEEARKQEELRQKREEQKKKREAEKKAQEEERRRREEEKRRLQEESRVKQQEKDRLAREARTAEKRKKDEERKKQQDEKDAKAAAARERKTQQEQEQREREREKARAEAEAVDRKQREDEASRPNAAHMEHSRRAPPPAAVALPPSLKHQKSQNGSQPSPQVKVATPAIPKITTPQLRQPSAAASQSSSQEPDTGRNSKQSTPPSQAGLSTSHPPSAGSTRAPSRHPQVPFQPQVSSPHAVGPPPGMPYPPQQSNFPGMPHGINGYPQGMGIPGMHHGYGAGRGGYPMGPQVNIPIRTGPQQQPPFQHALSPGGMPNMGGRGGPTYGHEGPSPASAYNGPKPFGGTLPRSAAPGAPSVGSHSRQPSSSFENSPADGSQVSQPIGRPAPIQRPDSAKPERQSRTASMPHKSNEPDSDAYLGSSALLGGSEPQDTVNERRQTAPHLPPVSTSGLAAPGLTTPGLSAFGAHPQPFGRADTGFTSPLNTANSGWSSGWSGPAGVPGGGPPRQGAARLMMLRRLAVETLSTVASDDVEVSQLLNAMNQTRPRQEGPVTLHELQMILETEGDANNGGRNFEMRQQGNLTRVGLQRDSRHGGGVRGSSAIGAEIGSPLPGSARF